MVLFLFFKPFGARIFFLNILEILCGKHFFSAIFIKSYIFFKKKRGFDFYKHSSNFDN